MTVLRDYLTNQRVVLAKLWRQQQLQPNLYQAPITSYTNVSGSQGQGSNWSINSGRIGSNTSNYVVNGSSKLSQPLQEGIPQDGVPEISTSDLLYLSEIVDTALLKVYLRVNDALVGPLLRVGNRVTLEEAEQLLTEAHVCIHGFTPIV